MKAVQKPRNRVEITFKQEEVLQFLMVLLHAEPHTNGELDSFIYAAWDTLKGTDLGKHFVDQLKKKANVGL